MTTEISKSIVDEIQKSLSNLSKNNKLVVYKLVPYLNQCEYRYVELQRLPKLPKEFNERLDNLNITLYSVNKTGNHPELMKAVDKSKLNNIPIFILHKGLLNNILLSCVHTFTDY